MWPFWLRQSTHGSSPWCWKKNCMSASLLKPCALNIYMKDREWVIQNNFHSAWWREILNATEKVKTAPAVDLTCIDLTKPHLVFLSNTHHRLTDLPVYKWTILSVYNGLFPTYISLWEPWLASHYNNNMEIVPVILLYQNWIWCRRFVHIFCGLRAIYGNHLKLKFKEEFWPGILCMETEQRSLAVKYRSSN